jgi:hypothetical protein
MSEPDDIVSLFGAPAFVYADLIRTAALWLKAARRRGDSRFYLHQFHHLWSYLSTSRHLAIVNDNRSVPAELWRFVRRYLDKRSAHQTRLSHD